MKSQMYTKLHELGTWHKAITKIRKSSMLRRQKAECRRKHVYKHSFLSRSFLSWVNCVYFPSFKAKIYWKVIYKTNESFKNFGKLIAKTIQKVAIHTKNLNTKRRDLLLCLLHLSPSRSKSIYSFCIWKFFPSGGMAVPMKLCWCSCRQRNQSEEKIHKIYPQSRKKKVFSAWKMKWNSCKWMRKI